MICRALDALAFSGLWLGSAAGALCGAATLAMGSRPALASMGIAAAGTLVVYNIDHLRDLNRDRATTPARTAFVESHVPHVVILLTAAALTSVPFALVLGAPSALLLAAVLGLGLAHRRLKQLVFAKPVYLTAAWLAVVVGVPALAGDPVSDVAWVAATLGAALFANAMASNIRDEEGAVPWLGPRRALWIARALAALGGILAVSAAPPAVRPLAAVPLATLLALLPFRSGERYGLIVVDARCWPEPCWPWCTLYTGFISGCSNPLVVR